MSKYTGNTCPVCHKTFRPDDDIVVCPECGTPYHRACWPRDGVCVHADKHAAGFEWKPDAAPDDEPACPNCGAHNPAGAHFCNHCGVPLPDHPQSPQNPDNAPETSHPIYDDPTYRPEASRARAEQPGREPRMESYTAGPQGIYRREVGPDDPIEGIKARDWNTFVGPSSLYYLMQFFRMQETKHKVSISFAALLLGPVYFFYRKMWKQAFAFAALDLLATLPTFLVMLAVSDAPIVQNMPTGWLLPAMDVCAVMSWIVMVLRGLFAVYWYRNTCMSRIRAIYDQVPEGTDRQDLLAMRGGVSIAAVVSYLAVCVALTILLLILGVDPVAVSTLFGV